MPYSLIHSGEYSESVLIELFVGADDKNSSVNIIQVSQLLRASAALL